VPSSTTVFKAKEIHEIKVKTKRRQRLLRLFVTAHMDEMKVPRGKLEREEGSKRTPGRMTQGSVLRRENA